MLEPSAGTCNDTNTNNACKPILGLVVIVELSFSYMITQPPLMSKYWSTHARYCVKYFIIARWKVVVRTKNEADGLGLSWAHNLFVMRALDFLTRVVPNTETNEATSPYEFPYSHHCCSLVALLLLFSRTFQQPPLLPYLLIFMAQWLVVGEVQCRYC